MSFAKPISKNPTRGRSASGSAPQARPVKSKPPIGGTQQVRAPSISSTSSGRSNRSRESVSAEDGPSIVGGSSSRASSACSNRSAVGAGEELDRPVPGAPDSEPGSSIGQTPPSVNNAEQSSSSTPQSTSDSLQVAAQVYPWMYMTSTLDACFKSAETAAEKDLAARTKELSEEESDISDQRARLEAERNVEFYDELSTDKFATAAPSIMQAFLSHGDACTLLEAEALQLATGLPGLTEDDYYSPMRPYNAMLDKLEDLQREKARLHTSIVGLTQEDAGAGADTPEEDADQPSARAQMIHVFSACLPVLEARAANLEMAHELLEGAKENLAMSLHLESLEFSDPEDEEDE
ncbi:hypothetical protein C8R44DRAFT_850459 [Mycena epipterygia]|nr:hypothetical protein C8R44DRAFT_850459 [Mycena epipterygia]